MARATLATSFTPASTNAISSCAKSSSPMRPFPTASFSKNVSIQTTPAATSTRTAATRLPSAKRRWRRAGVCTSSANAASPRHGPRSNMSSAPCATWGGETGALYGYRVRHPRVTLQICQLRLATARLFEKNEGSRRSKTGNRGSCLNKTDPRSSKMCCNHPVTRGKHPGNRPRIPQRPQRLV